MCASKLRSLAMIKPSNLWCNHWSIFVASGRSFKVAVSALSLCCNLFPVRSNALVFSVLMYILFSVDHFSIFSKSLERARVKEVILFQSALKERVVSSAYISMVELFKCKGTWFTNRRTKTGPRIDPCGTLAWQVSAQMLYALVSQTFFALPDTIETRPPYLGWHRTLIISLVVVCDWLRRTLYGNQQILFRPWFWYKLFQWNDQNGKLIVILYCKLFSWRYFNSEFATCFSMILDRIVTTDMGR